MTLLLETIECIKSSNHTTDDIIFIGAEESGYQCTWDEYRVLADKEYDSGYGGAKVAADLIIVFSDGAKMWRGEYDGSEWWEFSTPFNKPINNLPIKNLFPSYWGSLGDKETD